MTNQYYYYSGEMFAKKKTSNNWKICVCIVIGISFIYLFSLSEKEQEEFVQTRERDTQIGELIVPYKMSGVDLPSEQRITEFARECVGAIEAELNKRKTLRLPPHDVVDVLDAYMNENKWELAMPQARIHALVQLVRKRRATYVVNVGTYVGLDFFIAKF